MTISSFIVVEGIGCTGKTSAIRCIVEALEQLHLNVVTTREPGGTPIGGTLRQLLLEEPMCNDAEMLLFFADRAIHINDVILPSIKRGDYVVSDRYLDSSYAYQVVGRGMDAEKFEALTNMFVGECKPGLTIVLDGRPEELMKRRQGRGDKDKFDDEAMSFQRKLRQAYLDRAHRSSGYVIINAEQPIEKVQEDVHDAIINYVAS